VTLIQISIYLRIPTIYELPLPPSFSHPPSLLALLFKFSDLDFTMPVDYIMTIIYINDD